MERIGNEEVLEQLPQSLQRLMAFERFHLHQPDRLWDLSHQATFDMRYLPPNCAAFRIPCFRVLRKHLYVHGKAPVSDAGMQLFDARENGVGALFPVHPLELNGCREFLRAIGATDAREVCVWAVPTSSTRTLLAWPDERPEHAIFIKTSLHAAMLGDRSIRRSKVALSVGLSKFVQDSAHVLPGELSFMSEPVGLVPRRVDDYGLVLRSVPDEVKHDDTVIAPLFSLFGGDDKHRPLFLTILERHGLGPLDLIDDVLGRRFARLWLTMSMQHGLMLESHAQDLLLQLSPDLKPLGTFVYRDFEGLTVDWDMRRLRGLPVPADLPHSWSWHETYNTWGYPQSQLVASKLKTSLFGYLYFVLNESEVCLREWQRMGMLGGRRIAEGEVTMLFSEHLAKALNDLFGVRMQEVFNVFTSLNRFLLLLMRLRQQLGSAAW